MRRGVVNPVRSDAPLAIAQPVPSRRSPWPPWSLPRESWLVMRDSPLFVLVLILSWLGVSSGLRPLALPDEGRYVGVAWEMLRSGDWLTPTLDGLPFFHKPPLFYWITAGSLSTFGVHPWAGRVAPWLGASAVAFAVYLFTRRWAGPRLARAALMVLLTQPLFFMGSQYANLDMLVAGCIGVTILVSAQAVQCLRVGLPYRGWLVAAYAAAAVGVLAKGLIGVVLPVAVLLPWLAWSQPWRRTVGFAWKLLSIPGAFVFLAVAAPWFVAMQLRFPGFLHYFFIVQHFQRFAGSGFNNVQPFWFFVPVLLVLTLPWSGWMWRAVRPGARVEAATTGAEGRRDEYAPPAASRTDSAHCAPALRQLMWTWLVVIVVFFSIPGSKLVGYILPACAPLAFLVADAAGHVMSAGAKSRWWKAASVAAAAACLVVVGVVCVVDGSSTRALADAYATRSRSGEPLVMVGDYFYDVPLWTASRTPIPVVDDWSSPEIGRHDNWEKEMADAATFAADAGASVLIDSRRLPSLLCGAPVHWLIASRSATGRYDWLARLPPIASTRKASIWRIDLADARVAEALACFSPPANRRR